MFANIISMARDYARALRDRPGDGDIEVTGEIVLRLRQLQWLYQRIDELERIVLAEYERAHGSLKQGENVVLAYFSRDLPADTSTSFQPQEELRLLGESFYYSAQRILTILDQCQSLLPGLKPIRAHGVRRVRNNLIDHPNKKGGHPCYTFSVSNAAGLRLRTVSRPDDPDAYLDEGIHANAREFIEQLERALEAKLA